MAELKNALRAGDVSVSGSRQFRAFEEYLMPHAEFNEGLADGSLRLAGSTSARTIWMHICHNICHSCANRFDQNNSLAAQGQLPKAELSSAGLKVTPLDDSVPKEAHALRDDVYGPLPHVKITDLLLKVNRWTNFSRHFVHIKTGEPAKDPALLLTAILADATKRAPKSRGSGNLFRCYPKFRSQPPTQEPEPQGGLTPDFLVLSPILALWSPIWSAEPKRSTIRSTVLEVKWKTALKTNSSGSSAIGQAVIAGGPISSGCCSPVAPTYY